MHSQLLVNQSSELIGNNTNPKCSQGRLTLGQKCNAEPNINTTSHITLPKNICDQQITSGSPENVTRLLEKLCREHYDFFVIR